MRADPVRFDLPPRLLLVGREGGEVLDDTRVLNSWFREPGLVEAAWGDDLSAARTLITPRSFDVVVGDPVSLAEMRPHRRHRLAVTLQPGPTPRVHPSLAIARSVVRIFGEPSQVTDLLEAFARDLPVHEPARAVSRDPGTRAIRVESTRNALHDLRISDVYQALIASGRQIGAQIGDRPEAPEIGNALGHLRSLDITLDVDQGAE